MCESPQLGQVSFGMVCEHCEMYQSTGCIYVLQGGRNMVQLLSQVGDVRI